MANTNHNTVATHEAERDGMGRRRGHHQANREQQARQLRARAAAVQEDIESLRCWIVERAERYGWTDAEVLRGDEACTALERDRDELRRAAKRLEMVGLSA